MVRKKLLKCFLFCFAVFLGSIFWINKGVIAADNHILWYSSVDGYEIRYGGTTKHTTARNHGINAWNAQGLVKIAPDTSSTVQDLTFSDVYVSSEDWSGRYTWNPTGADHIKFNDRYFLDRSLDYNKKTATHELGHALGIDDHYDATYQYTIMYGRSSSVTALKTHDISDYKIANRREY